MAILNLDYLKTLFETYDKPTEQDFADLIDTLSTTIDIVTYHVPGTGDIWDDVNSSIQIDHQQKQLGVIYHLGITYLFDAPLGIYGMGGIYTSTGNYIKLVELQFTTEQVDEILALILDDISVTTTINITQFEKGVTTTVIYNSEIEHEDVNVTLITLNNQSIPIGAVKSSISITDYLEISKDYVLTIYYIYNGVSKIYTETVSVNGYAPQFSGQSATLDYELYDVNSILLSKYISATSDLETKTVYNDMYLWFILYNNNNDIVDQNQNLFAIGEWISNEYFISKVGFIKLQNGKNQSVKFYRSLNKIDSKGKVFKFESKEWQ